MNYNTTNSNVDFTIGTQCSVDDKTVFAVFLSLIFLFLLD